MCEMMNYKDQPAKKNDQLDQYMVIYDDDCVCVRNFYVISWTVQLPIGWDHASRWYPVHLPSTYHVDHEFRCLFCHSLMYQSQRVHGSNITLSLFLVERGGKIFPGPENKSLTYGHIFSTLDFRLVDLTRFCLSRTSHLFFQYIFSVSICRRLDWHSSNCSWILFVCSDSNFFDMFMSWSIFNVETYRKEQFY